MLATFGFTDRFSAGRIGLAFQCQVFAVLIALVVAAPPMAFGQSFSLSRTFDDPTVTSADVFGFSVALDGGLVLIGTPNDDTNGTNVGQAYLFEAATGNLLQTFNDPVATGFDNFGISVALDGDLALIGAYLDDTNGTNIGQAHLFNVTTGELLRTFDDPTPTGRDNFGVSVALNGGLVLIGAPFDDTNGTDAGQVYLFDAATGSLLQTFDDPTPKSSMFGDFFGSTVALDGGLVLIGASGDSTHGIGVGQAHLFDAFTGDLLRTFDEPTAYGTREGFGSSVALDGGLALIGARTDSTLGTGRGQAHLFDVSNGDLLWTFNDPTGLLSGQDNFGASVALDGGLALIGAPFTRVGGIGVVGQAHLFDVVTGDLLQTFDDPTPTSSGGLGDNFGDSVALDGGNVLIGAPFDNTNGDNVGQAHLFAILNGDLDGDGFVGINDLNVILGAWNQVVPPGNPLADPSGDGFVGIEDLNTVLGNWNAGTPPVENANMPEPGTSILLMAAILGLIHRRRT